METVLLSILILATTACATCASGYITVSGGPEKQPAQNWADAVWEGHTVVQTDSFTVEKEYSPGITKAGLSAVGRELRLGDKIFEHGIGVNSPSVLRIKMTKPISSFTAVIGVDRNADNTDGSVRFYVRTAGKTLFSTDVIKADGKSYPFKADLAGATEFTLEVDDGGDTVNCDQADWCDAKITFTDGSSLWLDEIAGVAKVSTEMPFSFVYGGKSSREFLSSWKSETEKESLPGNVTQYTRKFTDPATGLQVKLVGQLYSECHAVAWTLYFKNTGMEETPVIENVRALDVTLKPANRKMKSEQDLTGAMFTDSGPVNPDDMFLPELHRMHGSKGCINFTWDDFQPVNDRLKPGNSIKFGQTGLNSSFEVSPFFDVAWNGGGAVYGIGWTGKWDAAADTLEDGSVRLTAGMTDLHTILLPGEEIRSPRIMQVLWSGDDISRGYNYFRRAMTNHVIPRYQRKACMPPIAHMTSSEFECNGTNEEIEKGWLDSAKGLGFEYYWLDAWYMKRGFPKGMGNWTFPINNMWDETRFPNGPKAVAEYAHSLGIPEFLMWFAPEAVMSGTTMLKEHPEWCLKDKNVVHNPSADDGYCYSFNFGNPEAREYATNFFDSVIKELGLSIFRVDSGMNLQAVQSVDTGPNRLGISEIRCIEGLYKFYEDLIARNPGLIIDNCCGGGTRLDLESLSRSIPFWRTDCAVWTINQRSKDLTAILSQIINLSLNRYVPLSVNGMMGAEPYYIRSAFNGGISFNDDSRVPGFPKEQLKQGIAECKRLRKYILGDFYPLFSPGLAPDAWCAWQYDLPDTGEGAIFVFRRGASPYSSMQIHPKAIDADAKYKVTVYESYDPKPEVVMKGSELLKYNAELAAAPGSLLIEYKKLN
ncbi:MAG: NPCBM/NEW2 domain-containing protein [Armatimonadota bacterium]